MASVLKEQVDLVSKLNGLGQLTSAQANTYYGINHRGLGNPVPINTDQHGLTFFTRPRLNLSYDNIAVSRILTPLLTGNDLTIQRIVRALLDPVGAGKDGGGSRLVDNKCAFIPVLSNNLVTLSGWPDVTVDTYTSKEGVYKEAYSMVDGVARNFGTYDITAGFRNIAGDPITLLFNVWVHYAAQVYAGNMMPHPDSILEREIDYNTRIYRLIMDPTKKYVQKIGACGAAFPMASPLGAAFNFEDTKPFNSENDQISIPFRCMGADYLDPILIEEFNTVVVLFNPAMHDSVRSGSYLKMEGDEKNFFNYHGYPRINPESFELEWWIGAEDYKEFANANINESSILGGIYGNTTIKPSDGYVDQVNVPQTNRTV